MGPRFWEGTVAKNLPHETLLASIKRPVLLTHHARFVNPENGSLFGAMSDLQAAKVQELVKEAGAPITYESIPNAAHAMHTSDPEKFAEVVTGWAKQLPA